MCTGYVKHHHGGIGPFKKPKYDDREDNSHLLAPMATSVYRDSKTELKQEDLRKKGKKNGATFLTRAMDRGASLLNSFFGEEEKRKTLG